MDYFTAVVAAGCEMLCRASLHSISVERKTASLQKEALLSMVGMYHCNAEGIAIQITRKHNYFGFDMETECSNAVSKAGCCLFSAHSVYS
jgi:hypothetical protein